MIIFLYLSNDTIEIEMIRTSFMSSFVKFLEILFVHDQIFFNYSYKEIT